MNRTCLAFALLFAIAATSAHAAERDVSKVNGSIHVDDGERYGSLDTVNGSIEIGDNARVDDAETVNGSIEVGTSTRTGSLETVNGGIFVGRGGTIGGGIETVNGAIGLVDTDVSGGIETVNGDVTVGVGSHVRGGLHYAKQNKSFISIGKPRIPRVIIGPNAQVDGPLHFEREVVLYVHATAKTGAITGATAIRFDTPTPPEQ